LGNTPFGVGNALDNNVTGNQIGNALLGGAGNDRLDGSFGNDVLYGESGNDIFVAGQGTGIDVIGDFIRGQDRIDVSAFGFSFAELQSRWIQDGTTGGIYLDDRAILILLNTNMSQLTASDFILTPVAEGPPKTEADVMDVVGAFEDDTASALFTDDAILMSEGLVRWQPLSGEMFV
jgi:hypothetical protein